MPDPRPDISPAVLDVLCDAVLAGAAEVVRTRLSGLIEEHYKDATELVTAADERSDAAMRDIFATRLPPVDPAIVFHLEESGQSGTPGERRVGGDPLDGTSHFATGGTMYSVQAHYVEDGVARVGVVFQPEVYYPLAVRPKCAGRLVWALRGGGAFVQDTTWQGDHFQLGDPQLVTRRPLRRTRAFVACVSMSGKLSPEERAITRRVQDSGLVGSSTGTGGAGGNVLMAIFGGQDVYANFGAGEDLDLVPPQVIAEEAGLTVWGRDRCSPIWHVRKQPFVVAPSPDIAEMFLTAAGV